MLANFTFVLLLGSALAFGADPKLLKDAKAKVDAKKFDEAIALLDPAYKANPKDPDLNKALADAHLKNGDSYMYNEQLPPRMKYRPALKEYRAVLVYDKDNKDAKTKIQTIESIYKSMGMPIPQ
jgi:tetratricopeptide (TPR) repeat protein